MIENKSIGGNQSQMSQIDTNVLFFTYCIMMVVKMAAR